MLSNKQILLLSNKAKKEFKIAFDIKFLPYVKFKEKAKKSPLIRQVLDEGFSFSELKIPALIYHDEKEHIYLCKKIIEKLIKNKPKHLQKNFIEAMLYHEIFHIFEKSKLDRLSFFNCMKLEERVCRDFKKRFPKLYKLGKEIHSEATKI